MILNIEVAIINQLSDNYSYIIYSPKIKTALIIDPAESKPLIGFLKKNVVGMLIFQKEHSNNKFCKFFLKNNKFCKFFSTVFS